jgi:hypothetical protein
MMMTRIHIPPLQDNRTPLWQCLDSWYWLVLLAAVPRIASVFLLPNAFGDAYAYLHQIDFLCDKMAQGSFSAKDLFGFWLPLYQFVCALISVAAGHSYYIARFVSAVCGIGVCLLAYKITLRLTSDRGLSWLVFALAAFNPLHIFYSGSALTDIPHSFLVMACLDAMMRKQVKTASVWAAAAGLVRPESWMLIVLLSAWQLLRERRISFVAFVIPLVAPVIWLYLSWAATGNFLTYFAVRNRYVMEYVAMNPAFYTVSFKRVCLDLFRLLDSTNIAVLAGCLISVWHIFKRVIRPGFLEAFREQLDVIAVNVFFLANLGFLLLAYVTGNQPDIWSRYGLLFFALGLPLLAWAVQAIEPQWQAGWRRMGWFVKFVLSVFLLQMSIQVVEVAAVSHGEMTNRNIGRYLHDIYRKQPDQRFICDDGAIQYNSGIPEKKFMPSWEMPANPDAWRERLHTEGIEFIISGNMEISLATKLFPEMREGKGNHIFRLVKEFEIKYFKRKVWIYQVQQ